MPPKQLAVGTLSTKHCCSCAESHTILCYVPSCWATKSQGTAQKEGFCLLSGPHTCLVIAAPESPTLKPAVPSILGPGPL